MTDLPKRMQHNRPSKKGQFSAWEEPQTFSEEVRASFSLTAPNGAS
jgi:hypothetical protein